MICYKIYIDTKSISQEGYLHDNLQNHVMISDMVYVNNKSYFLYAFTTSKKLFKFFIKTRNKDIFVCDKEDLNQIEEIPKSVILNLVNLRTKDEHDEVIQIPIPLTYSEEKAICKEGLNEVIYDNFIKDERKSILYETIFSLANNKYKKILETLCLEYLLFLDSIDDYDQNYPNKRDRICLDEFNLFLKYFKDTI